MKTHVVFFGGFQSSQPDMDLWLASAQQVCPGVIYNAFPYPAHASFARNAAANGFDSQYDDVLATIANVGADSLFIVGHSSGCAIANELNSRLPGDHKGRVTLIDLDGFSPWHHQIKGSDHQVWSAVESGGNGKSVNWDASHRIFPSGSATQPWSLHFSLVNMAATDIIDINTYPRLGYAGCIANLYWLP
jgi:pimeloyl-ACP methyl ester carboxylesterase